MIQNIVEVLHTEFSEPQYRADLAPYVGGRTDQEIACWLGELAREHRGATLSGLLFATKSVGAVFGLELASGERLVLKLFSRDALAVELRAMERCVDHLVERGFQVPRPLTRLFALEHGGFALSWVVARARWRGVALGIPLNSGCGTPTIDDGE